MKKHKVALIALSAVLVLGLGIPLAYQNSSTLMGAFGRPPAPCPVDAAYTKTIYVKAGVAAGGTGTKLRPYNSIASAQTALETDSTIKRVCFSGAFTGTLDLDAALPTVLTLSSYGGPAAIESRGHPINMETGLLDQLTIKSLTLVGSTTLAPATSLTLTNVTIDGDARTSGLWIGSTDTVTISQSAFSNADDVLQTTHVSGYEVGSMTVSNTTFDTVVDHAITTYSLDSLALDGVTLTNARYGVETISTTAVSVTNSDFTYDSVALHMTNAETINLTGNVFTGGAETLFIYSPAIAQTTLVCQNNFISSNTDSALVSTSDSSTKVVADISNNSFYDNRLASSLNASGGVLGAVVFENNVFYANASQAAFGSTTMAATMTSDYNLFYGSPALLGAPTLADWQTTGLDLSSIEGDPLFVSTSDLHLSSGSPAIDVGTDSSATEDIDGDVRSSGSYDMGADEY